MYICFGGLTSVVGASPLDTIPPVTDSFIPVNQRSVEPVRNPGDFIGRVFAPKPEDWQTRPEAQPITGVTVTIASGPRAGESVATNPSGYYRFQNVIEDELHLRVEKEHFEPKEVMVHHSRPTILANGDVPNYTRDPQQHPGNILIGHRWPDEVRFILEETLVVHDLLYVEGGRPPKADLGGFYSLGVIVLYSYQYADWKDEVGLLGSFAHEIAHAHQHATVSVDGSAWEIHGWRDTPEGIAYAEAERKDWQEVGKAPYDDIYGRREGRGGIGITETAAETCAHYWSVDRWGSRTSYGFLEIEAPHRYKWAEKWVPINIDVRLPPKVVSIPDRNLVKAVRKALGLGTNVAITQQWMQRLTKLEAKENQIKDLTGLEHATRLRWLDLRNNQIRDIRPLANLKKLQELILDDNRVRDITPLANMTQLTLLLIGSNPISDFTPLANLNQLEWLSIWGSNFSNTVLLVDMTQLTHLWLGSNKIDDITSLTNLTQLKILYLPHNQIRDVSPLARLVNLETLHLHDNSIRDISPLTELAKLTDLRLGENPITDKSPLRTLKERNPKLKLDIEIPPASPVVHVDASQRPPLYWVGATPGTLHRLIGDEVEILLPNVRNATHLALDAENEKLYWTEQTSDKTGRIRRASLDGTNVQLVKNLTSVPLDVALDTSGGKIYLTNGWGKVQRMNVDGSNFQSNLITGLESPKGLALDVSGGKIYWTEMSGRIRRANLDGSNIRNVLTGLGTPTGITVFNNTLYWTERTGENRGEIRHVTLNGNPSIRVHTRFPEGFPMSLAVDAVERTLYWTTSLGKIGRSPLDGTPVQSDLVTGLHVPGALSIPVKIETDLQMKVPGPTAAVLRISPSPVTSPAVGERLTLNLKITAGEAVAGYQLTLQFDPTALRYVESSNGEYLPTGAFFVQPVVNRDRVELAATALAGVSNGDGTLATITFEVLSVKASTLTLSEPLLADSQGNTFRPRVDGGEVTEPPELKADVNGDGVVNIQDLVLVASSFGKRGQNSADVNADGVVNIADLVLVAGSFNTGLGAPSLHPGSLEMLTAADVREWLSQAHQFNGDYADYQRGVLVLEQLLAVLTPKETILLANYPNPFNPETWIPYQLAKSGDVKITIYDARGSVVRVLTLGHQSAGYYTSRSRAAYWNGCNTLGERVASGLYFYQLETDEISSLRKMVILK